MSDTDLWPLMRLYIAGWVNNDGKGVTIEVQGERERVERLTERLASVVREGDRDAASDRARGRVERGGEGVVRHARRGGRRRGAVLRASRTGDGENRDAGENGERELHAAPVVSRIRPTA